MKAYYPCIHGYPSNNTYEGEVVTEVNTAVRTSSNLIKLNIEKKPEEITPREMELESQTNIKDNNAGLDKMLREEERRFINSYDHTDLAGLSVQRTYEVGDKRDFYILPEYEPQGREEITAIMQKKKAVTSSCEDPECDVDNNNRVIILITDLSGVGGYFQYHGP